MSNKKDRLYILDTNVLFYMAGYYLKGKHKTVYNIEAMNLYRNAKDKICIVDLVWTEFLGVYLQKNINYNDYQLWYRKRYDILTKLFAKLFKDKAKGQVNYISIKENDKYEDVFEMARSFSNYLHVNQLVEEIIEKSIEGLEKQIEWSVRQGKKKQKVYYEEKLERIKSEYKILDGIDSALVVYAHLIQKAKQDKEVILVTDDKGLKNAVNCCRRNGYQFVNREEFKIRALNTKETVDLIVE